jgi:hypothetical protein
MLKQRPFILIKLDVSDTPKFLVAIDNALCNGWTRDARQPAPDDDEENMVFFRGKFGEPSSLALNFLRIDSETMRSGYILPYDVDLTPAEYQSVLDDFRQSILSKVLDAGFLISVMPHSGITPISDLMTPNTYDCLVKFSDRAWKKFDEFHPRDHDAWFRWLVILHRTPHRVTPAELGEWARDQGFSERAAAGLQEKAEAGLRLLKLYDDYFVGWAEFKTRSSKQT